MQSGLVFNLQRYSIHDGPGIRTTVFLKGCPLRCWWCHNPEGQATGLEVAALPSRCVRCGACVEACPQEGPPGTVPFFAGRDPTAPCDAAGEKGDESDLPRSGPEGASHKSDSSPFSSPGQPACTRCGACVEACPTGARQMVGRTMTVADVMGEVLKDRVFYEESGGGVTFSGGEPLAQIGFLRGLLEACRVEAIHTALDTCGYAPREDVLAIVPLVDLFLYDVKALDDERHRAMTGVSNTAILDNLRALGRAHANLWLRVPIMPGLNDGPGEIDALGRLAAEFPGVRQVNLLPYHRLGSGKGGGLGKGDRHLAAPLPKTVESLAERLRAFGLRVHVGG